MRSTSCCMDSRIKLGKSLIVDNDWSNRNLRFRFWCSYDLNPIMSGAVSIIPSSRDMHAVITDDLSKNSGQLSLFQLLAQAYQPEPSYAPSYGLLEPHVYHTSASSN